MSLGFMHAEMLKSTLGDRLFKAPLMSHEQGVALRLSELNHSAILSADGRPIPRSGYLSYFEHGWAPNSASGFISITSR
jgi:hypothetical protein